MFQCGCIMDRGLWLGLLMGFRDRYSPTGMMHRRKSKQYSPGSLKAHCRQMTPSFLLVHVAISTEK